MADLPVPLLDGYDGHTLHRPLAEHRAETAVELLTWSRIDDLDLASVNDALHTHPRLGGSTAVSSLPRNGHRPCTQFRRQVDSRSVQ
ncbi:hypothetical protein [Frankia sp. Cas3]|uniref:hypothetical protein n=1 Tax=Frankia sp. Cas3 TaxID=3073926 RepID=UPI002AD4C8C9|nr:hypothetical protein [Frankia sp. Cas3]